MQSNAPSASVRLVDNGNSALIMHDASLSVLNLLAACVNDVEVQEEDNPHALDITPEITMYGKKMKQPRDVGFFSVEVPHYNYSTTKTDSKPLSANMKQLMEEINQTFGAQYNGLLINRYNDGMQGISAHSDDYRTLDENVGVLALSYGAVRTFVVREKTGEKRVVANVPTDPTKIMQMWGNFQNDYTHEIPKDKKNRLSVRYSFTFRKHTVGETAGKGTKRKLV